MRKLTSFGRDTRGAAAAEMALVLPLVLVLLFVSLEAGYFLWSEHKVVEAVRNGARFASRAIHPDDCPLSGAMLEQIQLMTRTGQIEDPNATPLVPGWTSNAQVTVNCAIDFLDSGIYEPTATQGKAVTIRVTNLPYPSLFEALGVIDSSINLNASASTAVIGV